MPVNSIENTEKKISKLNSNDAGAQYQQGIYLDGESLAIEHLVAVAVGNKPVYLSNCSVVTEKIHKAHQCLQNFVKSGVPIYGVTTNFGGLAHQSIEPEDCQQLQKNLIKALKTGAGDKLKVADVRAAMVVRANALMKGASGIRLTVINRLVIFLNAGMTPVVYELGSIGASGDLVPLSYIAGAIIGLDDSYQVEYQGNIIDCLTALKILNLSPLTLEPKEALSLINGTSVMAGIASNCIHEGELLTRLSLYSHAFYIQALTGSIDPFHEFTNKLKPHPGQMQAARYMRQLLDGSSLVKQGNINVKKVDGQQFFDDLVQDRYSIRCLPQYLSPCIETIKSIATSLSIEVNSATDNPLIDVDNNTFHYTGNFLGLDIAVNMDRLRHTIGLISKHLDVQIALLVSPEFNRGLPASLVGNQNNLNLGLKGLQLCANSIMPMLTYYGNSISDRFPTHAEQYNQNINSQGMAASVLTTKSLELFKQYSAIALLFGIQAVEQRCMKEHGSYDPRAHLSKDTRGLYELIYEILALSISAERPLINNDQEQALDSYIMQLVAALKNDGKIMAYLQSHAPSLTSQF
ncbi:aromatic amino acid lyase [Shewanella sp. VB17]|uniref:HAL/PAL/TAL family ammonia-lyase n=1 Tax=Shewanella sp. VB17 TaxID=2739432 RepID=UPI001567AFE5|nr:aromatic amino acid ammonia-lyase [Shewanella sp. VB17]NRD72144.1 aromatic amino acid lyase [Shewanella sp. VB17]